MLNGNESEILVFIGGSLHSGYGVRGDSKETNRSAKGAQSQVRRLGCSGAVKCCPRLYREG